MVAATLEAPKAKPRYRGILHEVAFFVSIVSGPALVAAPGIGPEVAVATYATSMTALFGVSAPLHGRTWSPENRRVMRRLDHSMIFFLIAGTSSAVAPLALHGTAHALTIVAAAAHYLLIARNVAPLA